MVTTENEANAGLRGRFWIQGDPEEALPGTLFLRPGAHPLLELDGALVPLMRETSRRKLPDGREVPTSSPVPEEELTGQYFTVHGTLDKTGEDVTLPSAFTIGWTPGTGPTSHRLQSFYALLGAHVDGADTTFTSVRLRIRHLDAWANLPGFWIAPGSASGSWTLVFEPPEVPPATMANGARIVLEQMPGVVTPTICGGHLERHLLLDVIDMPPATYRDLDRTIAKPLTNLLALAVGKQCPLVEMLLSTGTDNLWLTVHNAALEDPADEIIPLPRILLPMAQIGLEGVASWLESTASLGPLPSIVAKVTGSPGDTLETQLLQLATAAEGLHRLLLHPQPTAYASRLRSLAEHVQQAAPGVTGHTAEWVRRAKTARNDLAHQLEHGFLGEGNADEWTALLLSMQWLLTGTLLLKTGVSPDKLGALIGNFRPYQLFLTQARTWLPDVYDTRETSTGQH
jgi:ApeA N-terminal domain 1